VEIKCQLDATVASGACHGSGWCISSKDVQGRSTTLFQNRIRLWNSVVDLDYWIYLIPTHDTHQWLLIQFLVLLMMGA